MTTSETVFIFLAVLAVAGIAYFIAELRPVRLFFLRRMHARIIRLVEAEMRAEYGEAYRPDPTQGERLWQRILRMHGLEER